MIPFEQSVAACPSGGIGAPEALIIQHTPMLTCRAIPEPEWERLRKLLVFYFAHRGFVNAEDLAQETLAEVWRRDDFEFQRLEDFPRICYGFASRIHQAARRDKQKYGAVELDENQPAPNRRVFGMNPAELAVYLNEVIATGSAELGEGWSAIEQRAAEGAAGSEGADPKESNKLRVRLHRARKKLGELTGWNR